MKKKVNVLMSTYNGALYLNEQIASIMQQEGVDVNLLVRDDGSSDETQSLLSSFQAQGILKWYSGNNLGPAKSFLRLLADADPSCDYFAFADQDDFWQKEKLLTAVEKLEAIESPALYFSRTQLTDEHLNPTGCVEISPLLTFGESLVYEFVGGCTMVINKALRSIVNSYTPKYLPMHDVWVYSVALAVGATIVFDKTPHILYRQHVNNTIGQGQGALHEWKRRYVRLTKREHSRLKRAKEIMRGYENIMTADNHKLLGDFIAGEHSFSIRRKLMRDPRLSCANANTAKLFKLALLLNTY